MGSLANMSANHCLVFASPQLALIPVIIVWKELFVGAHPNLPFHLGSVKSSSDVGKSADSIVAVWTKVLARPDIPTHLPSFGFAQAATRSVMLPGSSMRRPSLAKSPRPPGSCAKYISAGLLGPSSRIMVATGNVLPYLTFTSIPVASSNCSTMFPTRLSDLPE